MLLLLLCLLFFFPLIHAQSLQYPLSNLFEQDEAIRIQVSQLLPDQHTWHVVANLTTRYGDWSSAAQPEPVTVPIAVDGAALPHSVSVRVVVTRLADDPTSSVQSATEIDLLVKRVPELNHKRFLLTDAAPPPRTDTAPPPKQWHFKSKLTVSLLDDFQVHDSPDSLTPNSRYFYGHSSRRPVGVPRNRFAPILFLNDMYNFGDDYILLNDTVTSLPLTISYAPQTLLRWQWMIDLSAAFMHGNPVVAADDAEDMRRMFLDTHPYLLYATSIVSILHILFDILAFKNDIAFWRNRKSFEGLSLRYLFASAFSQAIVFLYLANERSSKLVLIPAAISALVELWKITRAFTVSLVDAAAAADGERKSFWQRLQVRERHVRRDESASLDVKAWRTLGPILAIILIVYAVYTLVFVKHVGWYGWGLGALVGLVYGAGFIMMTPQLFINYRLKSVAHLPWRVFVYKAMNTFIDDLFAFVIKMPTMHRVACFRDDVVFFLYLCQRYSYPIDHTRVNEYGQTGNAPAAPDAANAAAAVAAPDGKVEKTE